MYTLFYSFFEAFPLTYIDIYHFNLGEMGLAFSAAAVGFGLATVVYWAYLYYHMEARIKRNGMVSPEERLVPALFASILMPVGMFIYGWTSRDDIHWIVPSIGVAIVTFGVFIVFQASFFLRHIDCTRTHYPQCIFIYLPMTYPKVGKDHSTSGARADSVLIVYGESVCWKRCHQKFVSGWRHPLVDAAVHESRHWSWFLSTCSIDGCLCCGDMDLMGIWCEVEIEEQIRSQIEQLTGMQDGLHGLLGQYNRVEWRTCKKLRHSPLYPSQFRSLNPSHHANHITQCP